jgi:hypothetical protein
MPDAPQTPDQDDWETSSDPLKEAALQADTAVRGAANVLTFGLADKAEAAVDAALGAGGPGNWRQRYDANLQQEQARNVYDSINRGIAKRFGEYGGAALGVGDGFVLGSEGSAALPIRAKGLLGEGLSAAKTVLSGDLPTDFQVRKVLPSGRATIADQQTAKGLTVEAKFGPRARLSKNQTEAQRVFGDGYRVDRWMPAHVGNIGATAAGTAGMTSAVLQDGGDGGD